MKITDVVETHAQLVIIDEEEYLRFGPQSWYKRYGSSLESVYFEEAELEIAYQQYTLDSIPK